jgi:hypothetical protein
MKHTYIYIHVQINIQVGNSNTAALTPIHSSSKGRRADVVLRGAGAVILRVDLVRGDGVAEDLNVVGVRRQPLDIEEEVAREGGPGREPRVGAVAVAGPAGHGKAPVAGGGAAAVDGRGHAGWRDVEAVALFVKWFLSVRNVFLLVCCGRENSLLTCIVSCEECSLRQSY